MCMIRQVIIRGTQVRFGNSVLGSKMLGGGGGGGPGGGGGAPQTLFWGGGGWGGGGGGGPAEGVLVDPSNPSLGG